MGILWDRITSQFIEIIEWLDSDHQTLVWRFPVRGNEIKNGAKLIVREGQTAMFVSEGKLADTFGPGTYTLTTQNLPILATLKGWKYGFNSPFKAEVYFVASTVFTDLKWGTQNPIMLRDPEIGPVRLRAFGIFSIKVGDPTKFLRTCAGTDGSFEVDEILGQLKRNLVSRFTGALAKAKVPALDLAGNYEEISTAVSPILRSDFQELGVDLVKFLIENISLPPEVEKVLDKRSEMGLIGNVQQFAAYQAASAIPDAAKTPNSMAGAGMGLAAGWHMGGQMANAFQPIPQQGPAPQAAPPPPPPANLTPDDMVSRLKKLDTLKAAGVLTEDEYAKKRAEILAAI
ncbi:MAG: SPFH domain-containing protein [Deltaproteobacteria bacterium]|nr:SPFH domain-containing protein [Deltaproteobacteria bacterium]